MMRQGAAETIEKLTRKRERVRMEKMKPSVFKRQYGISKKLFEKVYLKVKAIFNSENYGKYKRFKLSVRNQLKVLLQYYRSYQTQESLGLIFGVSTATIHRIIKRLESILEKLSILSLPSFQQLMSRSENGVVLAVDATECSIQRPGKNQEETFSGKKKQHTVKCQLMIDLVSGLIYRIFIAPGSQHDFSLFKETWEDIPEETPIYADSGYQGIEEVHASSYSPYKKPRGGELSDFQKAVNRALAKIRIPIEHLNRKIKTFQIFKQMYRNRLDRFGKQMQIVCGLLNLELC